MFRCGARWLCEKPSPMQCQLSLRTGMLCWHQMIRDGNSSLSLHSTIQQSKYRAVSCHQGLKKSSSLRSPKTWRHDLSHWNRAHCNTEKSEAAPESSRFPSAPMRTSLLAGGNSPLYTSYPPLPPVLGTTEPAPAAASPLARQRAQGLRSESWNWQLHTKKLSTESKKCSLLL